MADRRLERLGPFGELGVGQVERRQQSDHVAVGAGREQQQPVLPRVAHDGFDRRRIGRPVGAGDELDADHRAHAAHVADLREVVLQAAQHAAQPLPDRGRPLEQAVLLDHVERRQRGGDRHRIAAERRAQHARPHPVHDLGLADHGRQGEAGGERLGAGHQIGLEPVVVDRPPGAGAADAGLDLVVDPQRADLVGVGAQAGEEGAGRGNEPALPGDRLDHEGGHLRRADRGAHQVSHPVRVVLAACAVLAGSAERAAVAVGVVGTVDLGGPRREAGLVRTRFARERERHVGAAVERVREGDDPLTAGRDPGDLDGVLDRLGTGVDQEGLLGRRAGGDAVEALGQLDVALVHADGEAKMLEVAGLALDGFEHARMRVPDVHDGDSDGEVEVPLAVCVPDVRTLRTDRHDGVDGRGGGRDGGLAAAGDVGVHGGTSWEPRIRRCAASFAEGVKARAGRQPVDRRPTRPSACEPSTASAGRPAGRSGTLPPCRRVRPSTRG